MIRLRAFVIGALLIPPDAWWVIRCEDVAQGPYSTTISLFANAVFILALLVVLNAALRRVAPRQALSQAELLIAYVMVSIGASLAGLDLISVVMQVMAHPYRFATPENRWMALFGRYLPDWLIVSDPAALKSYYEGHSSIWSQGVLTVWLKPSLYWTGFIAVLLLVMMCINTLVRSQWIDRERLTFPIIQLPLAATEPEGRLWRNKLMWIGFAIAGGIDLVNGLALYYPSIPTIGVKHFDIGYLVTAKPWSAMGWTPVSFYPFVIGLGFLLPADLSFSCWFFYIFWKLQMVAAGGMAWDAPRFPYIIQQCFGGYLAVLATLLWTARGYLKQVWHCILGRRSELDDSTEAMTYRTAAIGAVTGTALLIAFMWRMGLSPVVGVAAFVLYFAISTAIARMRAELGPPVHDLHLSGPDLVITQTVGTQNLSARDLTVLDLFFAFNRAYRGHPMPIGIESMKMAQECRASQRRFLAAIMLAGALGSIAAIWVYLGIAYRHGASTFNQGLGFGFETYRRLEAWLTSPTPPDAAANAATGIGFAFALFLGLMRLRFTGWPFHPIGYAISGNWSMNLVWLPLAIAWLAKVGILKFGGMRMYRTAIPFFLGLILGQMVVGSAWSLYGLVMDQPAYSFWGA